MDQLKAQLAVVMKYGFWIGATLILLGSLGIWYMSTSQLAEENDSQTTKIKSAIQTVSSVQSELATHPNETSHQEMQRLIEGRQKEVLDAWQTLYDRQRSILTWPERELGKDFVKEFKDLIPIEAIIQHPAGEMEKQTFYLDRYQRYIKNVLPSIAKIADAEWTAQFEQTGGAAMMEMGMGMNTGYGGATTGANVGVSGLQEGPLVKWSSGSQQALLSDLFPWRGEQPSTLEVYYSQENLWILKQLLQIIDDVNGDARQPYQAKIHEINKIAIGKSVQFGAGTIAKPGARTGGMGMGMGGMDMMMDMEMDMGMSMDMDMSMDMGGGAVVEKPDPADNRYVNASMEPITGAELRSALTGNSPTTASLAVAKRVPVMMSLAMDQRSIHQLIAACGSAPLMVEVKQVRVLPQKAGGSGAGGMSGAMDMGMDMGGGMDMGMDMGMGGMGGGGYGGMAAAGPQQPEQEFPFDMTVEIYGLIYIYNPPDREKLGLDKVTEDTVIDGDTETVGGQPVAPPPSAAPAPATPTPATPAPAAPADGQLPPPTTPGPATPEPANPTTPAPASPTPPAGPGPGDATPPAEQPAPAAAPPVAATPTAPPAAIATPLAP